MKREKKDLSRTFKKGMGRIQKGAGFTLIELMVVIVIIGILASVALPKFMINQRKAKEGAAWADLDSMTTAMEMYYLDCSTYPVHSEKAASVLGLPKLITDTESGWAGPYMKYRKTTGTNLPADPWGNVYGYEGSSSAYTIWCKHKYNGDDYSAYYINSGPFKSP